VKANLNKWKGFLNEAGFARARQAMLGMVPNINTIAFLTAENPQGEKASPEFNREQNKKLENTLRSMNLSFRKVKGKFGSEENSYMVMNITRDEAIELGQMFDQEAVIWGDKIEEDDKVYFSFQYISGDSTVQTREISLSAGDVQDREDYFSQIKGRKFIIPFFDDDYEGVKQMVTKLDETLLTEERKDLLESYRRHLHKSLRPNATPRSRWHHRGIIKEVVRKLLDT